MSFDPLLAQAQATGSSGFLVGWWMALLMYVSFVPWAWLVSSKLDKDARYFHLNHRMWNGIHMGGGFAGLMSMLFIPVPGVNWLVGVILMFGPILVYWRLRNQAVPEDQRFHLTGDSIGNKLAARRQARATRDAVINFTDAARKKRETPLKDTPLYPTHMLAEDLLGPALEARATRLELAVGSGGCQVSQTIDGVRYKREALAADGAVAVIDYVKDLGGLDIEDRRRKQAGKFQLSGPNGTVDVDIMTAGSSTGQLIRMDFDRAKRLNRSFDQLGLLPSQSERLATLVEVHERSGIVLVGAPTGQGLTTTAYAFIARHDAYTANIKTLEREVQFEIEGVDHVQFDPTNPDVDYATALQSILRRDPDIVMTGQILDAETAAVAAEPALQGPLLYVPIVAPTISEQIRKWVKLVGNVKQATKALKAVTNQRLMRTLCPNCRQSYQPSPEQLKKLNLPAERAKQLYRSSGKVQVKNRIEDCPVCAGTGYLGQTAAFEVFLVDDEARKILGTGNLKDALSYARRHKMIYLQEAAMSKVLSGETTIEEVIRATAPGKSEGSQAA